MEEESLIELYKKVAIKEVLAHYELKANKETCSLKLNILKYIKTVGYIGLAERIGLYAIAYRHISFLHIIFLTQTSYQIYFILVHIFNHGFEEDFLSVIPAYPKFVSTMISILENTPSDYPYLTSCICKTGKTNFIEFLLVNGIHPKGEFIKMVFNLSVYRNKLSTLRYLLDYGCDFGELFYKEKCSNSVSFYCIEFGTIKLLEEYQIDFSTHLNDFYLSAVNGADLEFISYCIDNGADPNYKNCYAIYLSYKSSGDSETLKYLFERGVNAKYITMGDIWDIFYVSTDKYDDEKNLLQTIKLLIENGLNLTEYLDKLMIMGCATNYISIFRYFLELGADFHIKNDMVFIQAVHNCNPGIVQMLLELGVGMELHSRTILNVLSDHPDTPLVLVEQMDQINQSKNNLLNIHEFRDDRNFECVFWILIKYGAVIVDSYILQWIAYTRENISDEVWLYVLERIDVNVEFTEWTFDDNGEDDFTILEVLAGYPGGKKNHRVKFILDRGADYTMHNYRSLHIAITYCNKEIVQVLLERGAILDPDVELETNGEIIKLVEAYGVSNHKLKEKNNE
jgi:ankyrin repeat protein